MDQDQILIFGQQINILELLAMLSGIIAVWLTVKHSVWCFPVGIINVLLYAWLFFSPSVRLYADTLLQCIYVILLIYGWVRWNSKKEENPDFVPENMSPDQWKKSLLVFLAGSCLFGYLFQNFTDASLPWLDSTLTTASLIAQWMVAKKKIENWIIWIIANSVYIPLFFFKHLPLTSLLYFLFLIMAISGYLQWKKLMPANQS